MSRPGYSSRCRACNSAHRAALDERLLAGESGRWSMPKHPRLCAQFNGITSKPAPGGGMTISSPTTPDGAHGDLVSAVVGAVWRAQFAEPGAARPFYSGGKRR